MHTYVYRLNVLLTEAITLLALMCAIASLSDKLNVASPSANIQVLHINWFHKQRNGNDEVSLTMNVSADLKSTFTWNTKQVFVFLAMKNLYGIPSSKPQLFCAIITASPLLSSPSGIYG